MARFALLLKFTDQGIAAIKDSPTRAGEFATLAAKAGARVEGQYWLLGEYDGLVVLSAPAEETVVALALQLGSRGFVRTCLCRAYDEGEFRATLGKV
jgi:uncharacterized protein with GYD domain